MQEVIGEAVRQWVEAILRGLDMVAQAIPSVLSASDPDFAGARWGAGSDLDVLPWVAGPDSEDVLPWMAGSYSAGLDTSWDGGVGSPSVGPPCAQSVPGGLEWVLPLGLDLGAWGADWSPGVACGTLTGSGMGPLSCAAAASGTTQPPGAEWFSGGGVGIPLPEVDFLDAGRMDWLAGFSPLQPEVEVVDAVSESWAALDELDVMHLDTLIWVSPSPPQTSQAIVEEYPGKCTLLP
jgi:hypothetical protein